MIKIIKLLFSFLSIIMLVLSLPYLKYEYFDTISSSPFNGKEIFNPYQNVDTGRLKANFHVHSRAWSGLTNGKDDERSIITAYKNKGYDYISISNYHKLYRQKNDYIPVYEHGYNIFKSHLLCIGAKEVSYFDFPLNQTVSNQQTIINRLRPNVEFLVLAHPGFGGGRSLNNISNLVNYDAIEVANHFVNSAAYWDKILSSGKLVWGVGNDDVHSLQNHRIFQRWNVICSNDPSPLAVINALKYGQSYTIESNNGKCFSRMQYLSIDSFKNINFKLSLKVDSILAIGQDGKMLFATTNTDTLVYTPKRDDTYIRIMAKDGDCTMYFNAVVRYDGVNIPFSKTIKPQRNTIATWIIRVFVCVFYIFVFRWVYRFIINMIA